MSKRKAAGQPEVPQLSAFAIKRTKSLPTRSYPAGDRSDSEEESSDFFTISKSSQVGENSSSTPSQPDAHQSGVVKSLLRPSTPTDKSDDSSVVLSSGGLASGNDSPVNRLSTQIHPGPISSLRLVSTFKPNAQNVLSNVRSAIVIKLRVGETVISHGQYDFRVRKGVVTLMGATLRPSSTLYRVYAPSTHSIPVVKCIGTSQVTSQEAEVEFEHYDDGLRSLRRISPLFGRIRSEGQLQSPSATSLTGFKNRSFHLICGVERNPLTRPLEALVIPSEWNTSLQTVLGRLDRLPPKILVCGPKSSGKSTFLRHCCNHILTKEPKKQATRDGRRELQNDGVAIIDLDPGQPEYSAPGQLSLVHLRSPIFGPPYTHPILAVPGGNRVVRAHNIAAISPKDNPCHYTACALDLVTHYRDLLLRYPSCPLVINCSGWIFGPGLEVTIELIQKLVVSDVVYMSQEGLVEVVDSLKEAARKTTFHMLPSQPSQYLSFTSAELRSMQSLSYFHYNLSKDARGSWSSTPITSMKPWRVRYTGSNRGIHGIMVYGECQPPELLSTIIDGSLMAIVVLEDDPNIPEYIEPDPVPSQNKPLDPYNEDTSETYGTPTIDIDPDCSEVNLSDEGPDSPSDSQYVVMRTSAENLPYITARHGVTMALDPTKSHSIGLALVRGIDVANGELQILTPILESTIFALQASKAKIVLVGGKLDTPAWAYQEEYSAAAHADMQRAERGIPTPSGEGLDGWKEKTPWVRVLRGMEGKGVGEEVWRVRRNLKRVNGNVAE